MLTQDEYVKNGGVICPACKSSNVDADVIDADGPDANSNCKCLECGSKWIDDWTLRGYRDLMLPKPNPVTVLCLDLSHYTRFDSRQAAELPGIGALKLEFSVECDQEEAHAFLHVWQMLSALQDMLDGDVGISGVRLEASVVPDDQPF